MYLKFFKRTIDILVSIIGLPFFILLYIVLGILIKIEDKGPVLYKADRIGKNSKIFKMYKFRSMKVNAPVLLNSDGSTYNSEVDPRVTKIGKFLRETSIDEIPQILNVLKGNMSIIGPRASLASVLDTYQTDEIDKMKVRPGITGYTQAYYRNKLSNREKRLKDAWYSNNLTFWLDIKILIKTFLTVFRKEGLYTNNEVNESTKKKQKYT
ncbi:sugar transferase [Oceanobacillus alkalisoli]|uniref:sugar transferase n=1 Tax=Oceanobacillus alkalisoli TaxID=2925113 RepID=UPI001F11C89D|nr:sugar transferase [Oceanobacillus alkalisoli]MCF3942625.1 sugar transferase [Oceanobacillus alkalisoli]